jgi:hypothetical protein
MNTAMKCLHDSEIQSIVDKEAGADALAHAASCSRCAARVEELRRRAVVLERALTSSEAMPAAAAERVQRAIATGTRGATRLRGDVRRPVWQRARWSTAAFVGAAAIALAFIVPAIRGPETVSAAAILARSATTLSTAPGAGIEFREYELVLDGMPRELMPDQANGTYRIRQAIDHSTKGRFRFASYTSDGRLLTSIAQDPVARTRVTVMRVDDRYFRFEFAMPPNDIPSLPEIEQLHMEASVAMMQASGQQLLQVVDTAEGRQYRIEVPQVNTANINALWDLTQAHVVVDAADYRILEFAATGTFLKQPYSVSYKLIARQLAASAPPDTFVVPSQPDEILIAGQGSANPLADSLFGALRQIAQQKTSR